MKNNISKIYTSWINGLIISSILAAIIFFISLSLFIVDIHYYLNRNLRFSILDGIAFPIQIILTISSLLFSIYFGYNSTSWTIIAMKSFEKRRTFNMLISIFSIIFTILFIIDFLYRSYYLFSHMASFISATASSLNKPIFVLQLEAINPIQPMPFILLIISMIGAIFYLWMHFVQIRVFKSEAFENSLNSTQKHYTNSFLKDRKRSLARQKPKTLKKRLKAF